jgi:hypothetical protein
MSRGRFTVLLLCLVAFATSVSGQTHRASIRGIVVDPGGAVVPQVSVKVVSETTAETRSAVSDAGGRFAVPILAPGTYLVEVEHQGYRKHVSRVELQVNQDLWLDVALALGSLNQEVLVNAPAAPLEKESARLSTVIDSRQVMGLPLDGRNVLELSLLVPGAAPAPQGSASSLRGDFALSVNGGREDAQSFLLDGVYNIDPKLNTPGVRPPVDAIRAFEVLTSTYDASFGRNGAGQVNVVTHSGSNTMHGTAYGFVRTKALEARNFFAPSGEASPAYNRGQFGASLGGPIRRNRTFFFADYERTQLREGITRVSNVPSAAERTGDFSQSLLPAPINPLTGLAFDGNRIPDFFIHPVGRAIAGLYPLPNRSTPFANFVSSPRLDDYIDHFDARVDQQIGTDSTLTARYSFGDRRLLEPFASLVSAPGYGTRVPRRGQNLAVSLVHPFGSSLINETRFGYNRVAIGVFQQNQGVSLNRQVGLPELSGNPRDFGLSYITVTGFAPLGDEFTTPQESATDMYHMLDTATWVRNAHLIKLGADLRYLRQSAYRDVQSRGFLNFSDRYFTGNALADLLLGYPVVTGGATLDNPQRLRNTSWSAFVQDNFRLRPGLTLSAGLRYEYVAPAVDAEDRANLYDPATGRFVQVGTGGMPRGGYTSDRNNWAPRFGVAWTPDAAGQTVVRGGYGLYYNQGALATGEGLYFNAPYFDLRINVPFQGVPPFTLTNPFPQGYPVQLPASATAYQRDLRTPWFEHWSAGVQRQFGSSRIIEAAYVGSRGHELVAARDINQPRPSASPVNLRPNPQFDDITLIESRGRSNYNALQLKFDQRFDRGVSMLAAYTFGKSLDDASGFFASSGDPNFPQDSNNPGAEYGRSSFDVRQRFSLSFGWALPFADSAILRDVELQGIFTAQAGRPFTVALLPEFDNSNTGRSTLGFGANDRPNIVAAPRLGDPSPDRWFNTAAFSVPSFGSFGNAGRNILEGPGYQNMNLALLKHIALPGETRLQVRLESFNLFNRANFNLPDAFVGSPTFGRVVSADSPRRCQFGLRLVW